MRTILIFDLPTLTKKNLKNYRVFVKSLKKLGFYMIQESVYVKMNLNQQIADSTLNKIKQISPSEGSIMLLTITEKQFSSMKIILGSVETDVITSDERTIKL